MGQAWVGRLEEWECSHEACSLVGERHTRTFSKNGQKSKDDPLTFFAALNLQASHAGHASEDLQVRGMWSA